MDTFTENSVFKVTPIVATMPADLLTPLSVYLRLSEGSSNSFLLESVEGGKSLARYSFIGAEPDLIVTGTDKYTLIKKSEVIEEIPGGVFDFVRKHFTKITMDAHADLPSFIGGAIGYLGFECSDWFEPSLKGAEGQVKGSGDAAFMFYSSIVAFDHAKQEIKIISLVFDPDGTEPVGLIQSANERNHSIRERLKTGVSLVPGLEKNREISPLRSNWERDSFEAAVVHVKELIGAGECYQVVLSQRFSKHTNASPVGIYRAIRSLNPSPYMFLLRFGDKAIIGASPEMLMRCEGNRVNYRPIAGTRPRGRTFEEDDRLAEEMRLDKKETAEHLMLVDLGRNDLGRVAEFGSVNVDILMSVEKYSHVQHLVSSLSATTRSGLSPFDALAACFPAGTVSGAPKVRAIEIIRDLEPTNRGVYAGTVGYFDYSGNMDTCIAIRTLVLEDGVAHIQAGAGIVADSVPHLEFEETVNKAAVMLRAVEIAEADEF